MKELTNPVSVKRALCYNLWQFTRINHFHWPYVSVRSEHEVKHEACLISRPEDCLFKSLNAAGLLISFPKKPGRILCDSQKDVTFCTFLSASSQCLRPPCKQRATVANVRLENGGH